MAFDAIRAAIEDHFSTNYSTTVVAYDNVPFTPPATSHVRLFILDGGGSQVDMGAAPSYRYTGVVEVQVFVPSDSGSGPAMQLADEVATLFRGRTLGGVVCRTPYATRVGQRDGWYQVNVTVPFYFDEIGG